MEPEKLSHPLFTLTIGEFIDLLKQVNRDIINETLGDALAQGKFGSEILNVSEACEFLTMSKSAIYKMNCDRRIPHVKKGKRVYYKRSELIEWLSQAHVKTRDEIEREATSYVNRKKW